MKGSDLQSVSDGSGSAEADPVSAENLMPVAEAGIHDLGSLPLRVRFSSTTR
jgi:hypothetical protein